MEDDLAEDLEISNADDLADYQADDIAEDLEISHADDKHSDYYLFNNSHDINTRRVSSRQHSRLPEWTNSSVNLQTNDRLPAPSYSELFSSSTNSNKPLSTYNNELDKNSGLAGKSDKIPVMSDLFPTSSIPKDVSSWSRCEIVRNPPDINCYGVNSNHQNSHLIGQSGCSAGKPLPRISVAQQISKNVNSSNHSNANQKDSCVLSNGNDKLLYSTTTASQGQKTHGETDEADDREVVGELMTSVSSVEGTKDRMTQLCLEDKVDMLSLGSGSSMPSLCSRRLDEAPSTSGSCSEEASGESNMLMLYTEELMKNIACQPGQNVNVFMNNVENFNKPAEISEDLYERTQKELDTGDTTFDVTSTRVWREVKDLIEDKNKCIFLIGGSRKLKRLIGLKFLRHCQRPLGYSVLSLTNSDELSKCCHDGQQKAILIEDAFGVNKLKEDRFDKLCDIIKKSNNYPDIKAVVFTMTELCYYACKDRLKLILPSSRLEECIVIMETNDTALLTEIKSKFLLSVSQIVKKTNNINISPDDLETICKRTNPVFVECCEKFKKYTRYHTNVMRFFKYPMDCLNGEICSLREEWVEGHMTLIIVALIGEFNPNAENLNPIARKYLKLVHKSMSIEELCIIAKQLEGSYLIKNDSNFIFRHQMYQYAVLLCTIDKEFLEFLIENCPQTFLTDIIIMDFNQPEFYRDIYFGKPDLKCLIVNRLIREILNGDFVRLAIHIIWDSENFIKCFETECINRNIIQEVLNKRDKDYNENLFYWAGRNESDKFVKWIFQISKKYKLKIPQSIIRTMFVCCIKGEENTLKYLHERIRPINQIISLKPTRLLPIPVPENGYNTLNSDFTIENRNYPDNLLHTAVAHGHLNILKYYISEGVDINFTNSDGYTSLHIACRNGHSEIVQMLLDKGASVSIVTDKFQETVLHEACGILGNIDIVSKLLKKKVELVNKLNFKQQSVIHKAVASRNIEIVKLLIQTKTCLKNTAPLLDTDDDKNTVLHFASMIDNNIPIICYLLEKQPSLISKVNVRGNSPLHIACRSLDCPDTLESLLSEHADINVMNKEGNTPLHEACVGKKDKLIQFLLKQPKLVILQNYENKLPWQLTNDVNIIKLFKN